MPENLLESELFGYVEGAFTGARRGGKPGLFQEAHLGSIFLDEIGDLPLFLQARLLRVMQEKEVRPLGSSNSIAVDVRVIAATNRKLHQQVQEGKFRPDLYYRINVLYLRIPELSERIEDIPILVKKFFETRFPQYQITEDAIAQLKKYNYPGNVRQLYSILERAAASSGEKTIDKEVLSSIIEDEMKSPELSGKDNTFFRKMEKEIILKKLEENNWNKSMTARQLGISRTKVWKIAKTM